MTQPRFSRRRQALKNSNSGPLVRSIGSGGGGAPAGIQPAETADTYPACNWGDWQNQTAFDCISEDPNEAGRRYAETIEPEYFWIRRIDEDTTLQLWKGEIWHTQPAQDGSVSSLTHFYLNSTAYGLFYDDAEGKIALRTNGNMQYLGDPLFETWVDFKLTWEVLDADANEAEVTLDYGGVSASQTTSYTGNDETPYYIVVGGHFDYDTPDHITRVATNWTIGGANSL